MEQHKQKHVKNFSFDVENLTAVINPFGIVYPRDNLPKV